MLKKASKLVLVEANKVLETLTVLMTSIRLATQIPLSRETIEKTETSRCQEAEVAATTSKRIIGVTISLILARSKKVTSALDNNSSLVYMMHARTLARTGARLKFLLEVEA